MNDLATVLTRQAIARQSTHQILTISDPLPGLCVNVLNSSSVEIPLPRSRTLRLLDLWRAVGLIKLTDIFVIKWMFSLF